MANDSDYGLCAALFTGDLEKGERLARQIDSGLVYVNELVQSASDIPGGGVKPSSGYGKECHKEGLLDLSMSKSIIIEK